MKSDPHISPSNITSQNNNIPTATTFKAGELLKDMDKTMTMKVINIFHDYDGFLT